MTAFDAMRRAEIVALLRSLGACSGRGGAVPWVASLPLDTTPHGAWNACGRGDWIVWLLGELYIRGALRRQTLVLAACAAAEVALTCLPAGETRPRYAIETARRWCRGDASIAKVRGAASAADDAAASYASRFEYRYAAAAGTASAAADVADDPADREAAAADALYAANVADSKHRAATAAAVRAAVPWAEVEIALRKLGERRAAVVALP